MDRASAKAVKAAADVTGPLLETVVKHQLNLRHMEKKAQYDQKIAEKRAEVQKRGEEAVKRATTRRAIDREEPAENGNTNVVMDLMEKEDCSMCKSILKVIDGYEGPKRERALAEYGELKATMRVADDSRDLKEFIEGTDVLEEAIDEIV